MNTTIFSLSVYAIGITVTAIWLLTEILKKNNYYTMLFKSTKERQLRHHWGGAEAEGFLPAMGNMVFRAEEPFVILVGIWVELPLFGLEWFHAYGGIESDETNTVVIRTWLGKNPVDFVYQTSIPGNRITIDRDEAAQKMIPDVVHKPHWYQRWPLYLWG